MVVEYIDKMPASIMICQRLPLTWKECDIISSRVFHALSPNPGSSLFSSLPLIVHINLLC